jgi:ribonuclease III
LGQLISWLLEKLKQSQAREQTRYFSKLLTHRKFAELESVTGVPIRDKSYYIQALMHRSFLEQNPNFAVSNERLEFLGDAVLNLTVAEYLYEVYSDEDEGFLTKVRAKLVNRIALAEGAERIGLSKFLLVSKNLSSTFTYGSRTVLADAFEALIGAIYLDNGLDGARNFIQKNLIEPSAKEGEHLIDENYKSQLLEYAQANKFENPMYTVIKEEGPQHNRLFTVQVKIGSQPYGVGKGRNKKSAEQNAAHIAMDKIHQSNGES